jgi:ribosomal protein S12 methylthiotransferase
VQESLGAIGEALSENGKVLVTGCLGAKKDEIIQVHPNVLGITGAHAYEEVLSQVHQHLPPKANHNPFTDLVPPQGIKLTPRHYAYLKISEGCNHSCSFCIIPDMRGKLVSRPIGQVMGEAERLVKAGVKELLVISQDTSAYGVDIKHRTDFWDGRPLKTDMYQLSAALGELGVWVRLHYVYPYPHVDNIIPLMADGKVLPYLDIPFQHASPTLLRKMRRPGQVEQTLERCVRLLLWVSPVKQKTTSISCWIFYKRRNWIALVVSNIRLLRVPKPMICLIMFQMKLSKNDMIALCNCNKKFPLISCNKKLEK